MNKRGIKVVKRDEKNGGRAAPVLTEGEALARRRKDADEDERDMISAVHGWVAERRENSKAEGLKDQRQFDVPEAE